MHTVRSIALALVLALAGCGGVDATEHEGQAATPRASETSAAKTSATTTAPAPDMELAHRPEGEAGLRVAARRAQITAENSRFGRVLFDANGQVVYVFEIDRRNRSNCTS